MINVKGDQPAGIWAVTGHDAEAGGASAAKGVRYNEGKIQVAGEGAPGPLAQGIASSTRTASGEVSAPAAPAQAATPQSLMISSKHMPVPPYCCQHL
jgi:hypothetical protein